MKENYAYFFNYKFQLTQYRATLFELSCSEVINAINFEIDLVSKYMERINKKALNGKTTGRKVDHNFQVIVNPGKKSVNY